MSRLELRERYAGQVMGVFWAIITPLLTIAVYFFIFAFVFQAKMPTTAGNGGGTENRYALYLLSGLIPWMTLQDVMTRASTAVTANASLVKQVVFPLEILPLKLLFPALLNMGVALGLFLLYALASRSLSGPLLLALPLAVTAQLFLSAGIALIFSAAGTFLRDTKDIVGVLCFVLVYTMPVFFTPEMLPGTIYFVLLLNPLSHMILVYHDILYFGSVTAPLSWIIFPVFSAFIWCLGCRVFNTLKASFGNVL